MPEKTAVSDSLVRCRTCETYIKASEGFTCPRCRQGPFCRRHRLPGKRECAGCSFELSHKELIGLKAQERSIGAFMQFLQFLFLVFAIFFVAIKSGLIESVDYLKDTFITDNIAYIGAVPVTGYVLFYLILYNQRARIKAVEKEMSIMERTRMSR
ncbi:MAG: hypothetical protein HZB33_15445 [Nitrospirae bacterium]|nr:hypothetical protein [Nitrospirota bacterium]